MLWHAAAADSGQPNYFLLVSAAIICIFHLAGIDVAGVFFGGGGFNFVSTETVCYLEDGAATASVRSDFSDDSPPKTTSNRIDGDSKLLN